MMVANAKMRRLVIFYCIVVLLFLVRAAYAGLLTYASSQNSSDCSDDYCNCPSVPPLIYEWSLNNQQIPAIIAVFDSALLVFVSVWFMLTADDTHLLRTGQLKPKEISVEGRVEMTLRDTLGLQHSVL
jgi:hypothetical protein